MTAAGFKCEAYGDDAPFDLCFVGGAEYQRDKCASKLDCHIMMTVERYALHNRLTELAKLGDALAIEVLAECPTPADLLGGKNI